MRKVVIAGAAGRDLRVAGDLRDIVARDHPRAENSWHLPGDVDHGGLDPHGRRAAIQDKIHARPQSADDMLRGRRGHLIRKIRARRRNRQARLLEQLEGNRMRRHAEADRVASRRHELGDDGPFAHHQRERPGPERSREGFGALGPPLREGARRFDVGNVHDERVDARTTFRFIDAAHRRFVERMRAQPVDGLRGKCHEPTGTEHLRRSSQRRPARRTHAHPLDTQGVQ